MRKLNIIQIIDSLNTGGAEVLAVNIANELHNLNYGSHLCTTRKEGKLKSNLKKEVGYVFLNRKKKIDITSVFSLRSYIIKNNISIIHAHSTSYFIAVCVKFIYPKVKIIWHDHFGVIQSLNHRKLFPLKFLSLFFKTIISVNSDLEKWAKEKLLCKKVYFLNNFPNFNNSDSSTILKGLNDKRIIHLAAFREQKDHITLIKAFNLFHSVNKEWTLHLVGQQNNEIYSKKILDLIKKMGLQNHIFVYGSCLDIENILDQSSIGILSSNSEGLPLALLEYGLAKLPVIVTDVGECSKVVIDGVSGYVVNSKNYNELSEKILLLVSSNKKRKEFSAKHYANVLKNYSKKSFFKKVIEIYKD
ncbi:glycosyltransferase [Polaribacter aquimarinus]|uniref:Glycosyltransferase n=1 Tax=Polaribacter aquimarinus TaxID=2100726 RepID=A0A2U2J7I5_9FLAO|nr:glycosyltransferase [Polaribacter aquimarinus]PWG04287.1 glycosyltransferase [Polaribacter aquimarinus]